LLPGGVIGFRSPVKEKKRTQEDVPAEMGKMCREKGFHLKYGKEPFGEGKRKRRIRCAGEGIYISPAQAKKEKKREQLHLRGNPANAAKGRRYLRRPMGKKKKKIPKPRGTGGTNKKRKGVERKIKKEEEDQFLGQRKRIFLEVERQSGEQRDLPWLAQGKED